MFHVQRNSQRCTCFALELAPICCLPRDEWTFVYFSGVSSSARSSEPIRMNASCNRSTTHKTQMLAGVNGFLVQWGKDFQFNNARYFSKTLRMSSFHYSYACRQSFHSLDCLLTPINTNIIMDATELTPVFVATSNIIAPNLIESLIEYDSTSLYLISNLILWYSFILISYQIL